MIKFETLKTFLSIRKKLFFKYLISKDSGEYRHLKKNEKKIIVALAADYGNLGDVAITYAQTRFLEENFPEFTIVDFPISETFTHLKSLKKVCTEEDVITIVGGGNTGDMYDDIEYCRQFIIKQFPNNKIISFPQTVDFSDSATGRKALQQSIDIYSKHKRLVLASRERSTFEKYRKLFKKNETIFVPDIVLSLNDSLPQFNRSGITICFRNDLEKNMNKTQQDKLVESLKKDYQINFYDTHINKNKLSLKERESELNKIWTVFKKSEIVITDRLHGMIFCAITKTPCLAIDNSNRKISGVYNAWLKNLGYIKMFDHFSLIELKKEVEVLLSAQPDRFNDMNLKKEFTLLVEKCGEK